MKKLIIKRISDDGNQTKGHAALYDSDDKILLRFVTLEPAWLNNAINQSCIPCGEYNVKPRYSSKYGYHFIVADTSPREFVLFHVGNFISSMNPRTQKPDSTGCILVGESFKDINKDGKLDICSSTAVMKKLLALAPNGFRLKIIDLTIYDYQE